jgi:hypothetical protein
MKIQKIGTAVLTLLLFASSCNKTNEENKIELKPVAIEKRGVIHCSPYRNVTGITAVISELNAVSNCSTLYCNGNMLTTTLNQSLLTSPTTSSILLIYNSSATTPTQQSEIITSANLWANAHIPAGYYLSSIHYSPSYVVGPSAAGIDIQVTYAKCVATVPIG